MHTDVTLTGAARWIADHDELPVVAWDDEPLGFDPRSPYVETYWLAILGPSAVLAARRLASWLEGGHSGIVTRLEDLAQCLGLGHGTARQSQIVRTLDRLVTFGLARIARETYALRSTFPTLTTGQMRRLPAYLVERHQYDVAAARNEAPRTRSSLPADRTPS